MKAETERVSVANLGVAAAEDGLRPPPRSASALTTALHPRYRPTTGRQRFQYSAAHQTVDAWLDFLETVQELRPATILAYEKRLEFPLLRSNPDKQAEDFTEADLLQTLRQVPIPSRRAHTTAYKSFFRDYCFARNLIPDDPTKLLRRARGGKQHYVEVFTEAQEEALTSLPGEDGLRMLFMLDTGLRIGELCHLRVRDVNIEAARLVVLDGKGGKDRVVPLTKRLSQRYADWLLVNDPRPEDHVFGRRKPGVGRGISSRRDPLSTDGLRKWYYEMLAAAGVPRRVPHTTRHTFATKALRRGAQIVMVSRALGHASIQTTVDTYAHLDVEDLSELFDLLEA